MNPLRKPEPAPSRPLSAQRRAALQLVPVNRACMAGPGGACLVCDAPQGEPCRLRPLNDAR